MAAESNLTSQLQRAFEHMTATQKVMVGAITLTALLALAGMGVWASQERMSTLFSNLPPTDANRIVEDLKKSQVSYELSSDQRTISVPEARVGELRLKYAGEGLPRGEGIGFEKLEAPSLTTTDFTQKVIHRRALEGHLAATIKSLQQVSEATVHITPGSDSPFVTEKEDAKASVLLKLKGSRILPEDNTAAIVNLVAASVEGLKPENVVVIDQHSRILSRTGKDTMVGASDAQKKLQRQEEEYLVTQVTQLLEPVVGLGKVRATAHVELDFDKVRINDEKFDPQGQVERSVHQKDEKVDKNEGGGGVPGTPSNVPPATGGAASGAKESQVRKEVTTNYEISKTMTATEKAPGTLKRMSLAVIVDHATSWEKNAKGEAVEKITPRTADEIKKIKDQVAAAVGIQERRGDQLTVENLAFAPLGNPLDRPAWWQVYADSFANNAGKIVLSILGLIVFFLVVLPMLKRLSSALNRPAPLRIQEGEGEVGASSPSHRHTPVKSISELKAEIEADLDAEGASQAPEAQRRQAIKKRIQESATVDPETAASLVRSWLLEEGR